MSSDIKTETETPSKIGESSVKKETESSNGATSNSSDKKQVTFKDWKTSKESKDKTDDKSKKSKDKTRNANIANMHNFNRNNNALANNNNGNFNNFTELFSFFGRNKFGNNGGGGVNNLNNNCIPPLMPPPSFNNFPGMNFNNRNSFNNNNNFNNNFDNNFNGQGNNNFNGRNNFSNGPGNFPNGPGNFPNGPGNFPNGPSNFQNGFNNSNFDNIPDSFFASDGIFRQKDMMQKPLPNPFRNDYKANQLLNKLHNKDFQKPIKKKMPGDKQQQKGGNRQQQQGGNKQQSGKHRNSSQAKPTPSQSGPNLKSEPKIFIANPRGNVDGKPYLPKPRLPEENPDITLEERKQQWKEYREAMKPFKNRDFYNAKRVLQRLGKKDPKELDEKETIRLANAREHVEGHKDRLAAKYGSYTKTEDSSKELGELYLFQKKPLQNWDNSPRPMSEKRYKNYGNFGENANNGFGPGRKIVGGYSDFRGFVSGGMLDRGNTGQTF